MSWDARLLPEITLTSPEGNIFIGKWRNSSDPQNKTLGLFKTVAGNFGRVQDLGAELRTSSYVVYFDGDDCDIESERFITALAESGPWTIEHPVRGRILNQYPAGFDPTHDPTQSGNIVAVATSWVTDYPEDDPVSQVQRANQISEQVGAVNADSSASFLETVQSTTANLKQKINDSVAQVQAAIDATLGELLRTVQGAQDTIDSINLGITSILDAATFDALELAGTVQNLCQAPADLLQGVQGRISAYDSAIRDVFGVSLSGTPEEQRNQAVSVQMTATSLFGGFALAFISNEQIATRPQAIEAAELIGQAFQDMTDALDRFAITFDGELLHDSYFSQSETFDAVSNLSALCQRYLLDLAINLKAEKIITLENPTPAIFVSLDYYDSAEDEEVDLLIESNGLSFDEIIMIPAGKELVIYV